MNGLGMILMMMSGHERTCLIPPLSRSPCITFYLLIQKVQLGYNSYIIGALSNFLIVCVKRRGLEREIMESLLVRLCYGFLSQQHHDGAK